MAQRKLKDDQHHDAAAQERERFKYFTRKVSQVPKEEVDKERA